MGKKRRLTGKQLAELKQDYAGLKTITTYEPQREEFKTEVVEEIDTKMDNLLELRAQKKAEISDIENQLADTGIEYTQIMVGVRQQVVGQYGDDSPEYEKVGGTRTSSRKSGLHRGSNSNINTPNG